MAKERILTKQEESITNIAIDKMIVAKRMPQSVFEKIQFLRPGVSDETFAYYTDTDGNIFTSLIPRPDDDRFWPGGQEYGRGTMVQSWDVDSENPKEGSLKQTHDRLLKDEFEDGSKREFIPVGTRLDETARGAEVAVLSYIVVPKTLKSGKFYPINKLPEKIISHHKNYIFDTLHCYVADVMAGRLKIEGKTSRGLSKIGIKNMVRQITKITRDNL